MTLDGVEIITNSSASHFSLQKLDVRLKLISEATRKCGGVYVYSNVQGAFPGSLGVYYTPKFSD
jgi:NAD+ synthase (glutamine-hydrolysing)